MFNDALQFQIVDYLQQLLVIYNSYLVKKMKASLSILLALNLIFLCSHIYLNCKSVFYFCQLTIIGQILVVANFTLSLLLNQQKSTLKVKLFLSRLHLITISLQLVVSVGFWGIRLFLGRQFVDKDAANYNINWRDEILSVWVHGGSLVSMLYFFKLDQIIGQTKKKRKAIMHLCGWGLPFLLVQMVHWMLAGSHVYEFIAYMSWPMLISFEVSLYFFALLCDYLFSVTHGVKLHPKQYSKYDNISMQLW